MNYLKLLLPLLQGLGTVCKNLFLGYFLMKKGAEKQQLEDYKAEEKSIKDAKKITNTVNGMSDDKLAELFYNHKGQHPEDK